MESFVENVRLAGLCAAIPKNEQLIADSCYGSPEMRKRFTAVTSIKSRRLCAPGQFCSDLAVAASTRLLDDLGWNRAEVGAVVFVTQAPDLALPATACIIQERLGLSTGCAAFDINLGCSGYPYGLYVASSMVRAQGCSKVLLLVGDAAGQTNNNPALDPLPPLFGDAATATALEWSEDAAQMHFSLHTDGRGWNKIMERKPGGRPGLEPNLFRHTVGADGAVHINTQYQLKGEDVFNFSVRTAPGAVEAMLEKAGWNKDQVDFFVFHQANAMINEFIRKQLKLDANKVPSTLPMFGNTSCSTIPLTLVHGLGEELRRAQHKVILCGFGVGLSWGTVACEAGPLVCSPLIEV
jgi:3-oxoacyl-[acyl-carrier-protein] synthase-3